MDFSGMISSAPSESPSELFFAELTTSEKHRHELEMISTKRLIESVLSLTSLAELIVHSDPSQHLVGPFVPDSSSTDSSPSPSPSPADSPALPLPAPPPPKPAPRRLPIGLKALQMKPVGISPASVSVLLRWAVSPASALTVLAVPPLLALPAHLTLPYLPAPLQALSNPFTPFFLLSHAAPAPERPLASTALPSFADNGGQLYIKGPGDFALLAWTIVLFSFLRLVLGHYFLPAFARSRGITKEAKLIRFGEQGYSMLYFAVVGAWGLIAYWLQQFVVLGLGLEKRRSDYWELVLHHIVTVWMVSWSYLMNVTLLGNAVFVSTDVPDMLFSLSKLLNYLGHERAKVVSLGVFCVVWIYFRHYISIWILWSLQYEFHLVPEYAQIFAPLQGLYMAPWMRDQMFYSLCILQALNLFWLFLILRVVVRTILTAETEDDRSDAEEEDEPVPVPAPAPVPVAALEAEVGEKEEEENKSGREKAPVNGEKTPGRRRPR
ncbi:TLC domain-containing protein [Mycena leptocephala]|nr:TLC domain-containing protein [Mycena leptocephala]